MAAGGTICFEVCYFGDLVSSTGQHERRSADQAGETVTPGPFESLELEGSRRKNLKTFMTSNV